MIHRAMLRVPAFLLCAASIGVAAHAEDRVQVIAKSATPGIATAGTNAPEQGGLNAASPFATGKYDMETRLTPVLSVRSRLDVGNPDNSNPEPQLRLKEAFAKFEWQQGGVRAGKFDQRFGLYSRNVNANDFGSASALGMNPFLKLDGGSTGNYTLGTTLYYVDRTTLAGPLGENIAARESGLGDWPRRSQVQLGPPVDLEAPPAMAVGLDTANLFKVPGLGYHLGFQRAPEPDATDSRYGLTTGLGYAKAVTEQLKLSAEISYLQRLEGPSLETVTPSLAVQGTYDDTWRVFGNLSQTRKYDDVSTNATPAEVDRVYNAGLGYRFEQGPKLDLSLTRRASERQSSDADASSATDLRMDYKFAF